MKNDGRIPLVIGVVGPHANSTMRQTYLAGLLKAVLERIQKRFPHTQVRIITALNEHGSNVIEQAALDTGVEFVLAMPQVDKLDDEHNPERTALNSRAIICIPLPTTKELPEQPAAGKLSSAQLQNLMAYAFIARHCHILMAITDDGDQIIHKAIEYKLTGTNSWEPPVQRGKKHHLYPPDRGPVIRISSTPTQALSQDSYDVKYLCPNETAGHQYTSLPFEIDDNHNNNKYPATLDKLDEFNADVAIFREQIGQNMSRSCPLLPEHLAKLLGPEQENIHAVYQHADMLASFYQNKTKKITNSLYIFSALMPLIFILYIRVWQKPPVIMLYVLLSLLVYLIYWLGRKRKYQIKHLDYRALAEGLRVQFFWRFIESSDKERTSNDKSADQVFPSSVADCYLRKQNNVLEWIRDAIRIVSTPDFNNDCRYGCDDCLPIVHEYWVRNQAEYYAKSALRDESKAKQFDNMVLPLILAGGITSLFLTGLFPFVPEQTMLKNILILCVGYFPAIGGLLKNYAFTMGYEEQSRQYERLANDFRKISDRLETLMDWDDFKLIIHELGMEALRENGDWVALHRDRPVKVPGAAKSTLLEASIKLHQRTHKKK